MSVIQVLKAYKEYRSKSDTKVVLRGFNMNVMQGSIYAMMGSSGCGKTTLINCLVSISNLDHGGIRIFGEEPKKHRSRIGFMPQETALINEFTVKEMIWFYGTLYSLSSEKIDERLEFLSTLLELPHDDCFIRDCSGGQQRRISFALTLVHEPEILILDEPTVGVDSLLRAKIWDYLVDITRTKNVTVLLSTHYIEEARHSTHIGLMRNGVQVAEDSPQNILYNYETTSLEEAFVKISEKQEHDELNQNSSDLAPPNKDESLTFNYSSKSDRKRVIVKQTTKNIIKALLTKNFLQIFRDISFVFALFFVPIIVVTGMNYGMGGRIKYLKLGIVNEEVDFDEQCSNRTLVTIKFQGDVCLPSKASCRFIDELDENVATKKFYKSYEEAFSSARRGDIVGFVYFASNYTESMAPFRENFLEYFDEGAIQIHLDQTDLQKASYIQKQLYDTFQRYISNLTQECGLSKKAGDAVAIKFEALYGEFNFDFRLTMVPGFILCGYFLVGAYCLSASMVSDRAAGIWIRTLVAGAEPKHFLVSRLIEGFFLASITFVIFAGYAMLVLAPGLSVSSKFLLGSLIAAVGLSGFLCGLLFSTLLDSTKTSMLFTLFSAYPATFISGIAWPFEAMPVALQYVSYVFPFAYPNLAFRNIISKNATILDQPVYLAFLTLFIWIFGQLLLCFMFVDGSDKDKNRK